MERHGNAATHKKMASSALVSIPNIDRIRHPLRIQIQSASTSREILCSRDILQLRSSYFKEIIESNYEEDTIILPEDDPEESALFLLEIHTLSCSPPHIIGSPRSRDVQWNKVWASLSVQRNFIIYVIQNCYRSNGK
jgi:hypothetical protein